MFADPSRAGGTVDGGERREEDVRPVKSWSLSTIQQAALLADDGEVRYVAELCESLMGDERIGAKLEDRALALTAAPITFEQAPKGRQKRAALRAAQAEEDWYDMVPETELAHAVKWRRMLGFVFLELVWVEPDPAQITPTGTPNVGGMARIRHGRNVPRLKFWHPRHFRWDWVDRCWYLRLDGGFEERVTPGRGKWVMWGEGSRPWQNGLWRGLAIIWLLKNLAYIDWPRQSARHANGTAIMSGPEAYDQELRRQLTREWQQMGSAGVVWVPEGSKLEVFELQANTWQTYQAQISMANTAIDIAIMGANLPTEVSQGAGTGATAQMQTVQKRVAGDAREWETVEHYQIGGPWAKANFGSADVAPWAIRNIDPPADLAQLATTQKTAAEGLRQLQEAAAPVNVIEYLQQYKIPIGSAPAQLPQPSTGANAFERAYWQTMLDVEAEAGPMLDDCAGCEPLAAVDDDERDDVWQRWRDTVNMSASELRAWSENECSRAASVDPAAVIARNLRLLETPKSDWDSKDVRDAKRTISFVARMRKVEQGDPARKGCPSRRDISLRNWAFDPSK